MRMIMVFFILLLALLAGACQASVSNNIAPTNADHSSTPSESDSITVIPSTTQATTPTKLPSISANNIKEVLESFVQNNGGCQLPCVMGLTPGLSGTSESDAFIQYFRDNTREAENLTNDIGVWSYLENNQGGISLRFFEENKSVSIGMAFIKSGSRIRQILISGESYQYLESGGAKKQYGDPYFSTLLNRFTLAHILNTYGVPSQVLIRPVTDDPGRPSPPAQYTFSFVLVYPKNGFLIEYISERRESEEFFVGCPTKPYSLNISAWNPNTSHNLGDAVEFFSSIDGINNQNVSAYKSLEDVTAHNISQFHEMFRDPNSSECIETLKELWP